MVSTPGGQPTATPLVPELVSEGLCPMGHGSLLRLKDAGYCRPCQLAFWINSDQGVMGMADRDGQRLLVPLGAQLTLLTWHGQGTLWDMRLTHPDA